MGGWNHLACLFIDLKDDTDNEPFKYLASRNSSEVLSSQLLASFFLFSFLFYPIWVMLRSVNLFKFKQGKILSPVDDLCCYIILAMLNELGFVKRDKYVRFKIVNVMRSLRSRHPIYHLAPGGLPDENVRKMTS
ncbi:hypothetical protein U1Q18_047367 [Sarracenia purpurea var. burkii]